jgi:hypothetical protein
MVSNMQGTSVTQQASSQMRDQIKDGSFQILKSTKQKDGMTKISITKFRSTRQRTAPIH